MVHTTVDGNGGHAVNCPARPGNSTPQVTDGPWQSIGGDTWWVVAERPDQAFAAVAREDSDAFPIYFGWTATIERVCIRWAVEPHEEREIEECKYSTDAGAVEAWRITIEDR